MRRKPDGGMKEIHGKEATEAASNYTDASARERFWLLCTSTFLIFLSNSATALLAVIFRDAGHGESAVGQLLAIYGFSGIAGIFLSGFVARRWGALTTVRLGAVLMLGSYLSYALSLHSFTWALASRLAHGFAYGLFLAPSMVLAKAQLSSRYFVTLFGVFASMIPLPNAVGPSAAAWLLERIGINGFFVLSAAPMALGVLGLLRMSHHQSHRAPPFHRRYRDLIRHEPLQKICATVGFIGLMFGVVPSYMAAFLIEHRIPLAAFFTTFATAMFAGRFLVAPLIEKLSHGGVVGAGTLAMGTGFALVGHVPTFLHALLAGAMFGLGYSLCYPRLSAMLVTRFAEHDREKPLALFNMAFVGGTYATPWLIGALHRHVALPNLLLIMGLVAVTSSLAQLGSSLFRSSAASRQLNAREPNQR
jgi:MFS family permease